MRIDFADRFRCFPIAFHKTSANLHKITLEENTHERRLTRTTTQRIIEDFAYNNNPFEQRLARMGIELIALDKTNHVKPITQDGRPLRR